jgi:hypothetical protein
MQMVTRIDPLGREGQVKIDPGFESTALQDRLDDLLGRSRICGTFENNELGGS